MAIITPIDANLFRRRRQELAGREAPQPTGDNRMTTAQALNLVPSAIQLADVLTTPIISGIAEYARKQSEKSAIEQAKAARDAEVRARAEGAETLNAGQAVMDAARKEREAIAGSIPTTPESTTSETAASSAYSGQPGAMAKAVKEAQGAGGAFAELLGDRPVEEQGFAKQVQAAVPTTAQSQPAMQSSEPLDQTLNEYEAKIRALAEKKAAYETRNLGLPQNVPSISSANINKPTVLQTSVVEPAVERMGIVPSGGRRGLEGIQSEPRREIEQPPYIGRFDRSPDIQPAGPIPLTMDEIRKNAMLASISENPEDRRKVLEQLFAAGEHSYAPQSWSEIFNPSAAKERVQAEIMGLMSPKRGAMSELEQRRMLAQIENIGSQIKDREQRSALNAAIAPYKQAKAQADADFAAGRIDRQKYDTEKARIDSEFEADVKRSGIDLNVARTALAGAQQGLAEVQTTVGVPAKAAADKARAATEWFNAQSRRIQANAADWRAHHPTQPIMNFYGQEAVRLDREDGKLAGEEAELSTKLSSMPQNNDLNSPEWRNYLRINGAWLNSRNIPSTIEGVATLKSKLAGVKEQRRALRELRESLPVSDVTGQPAAAAGATGNRTGIFNGTENK